MTFFNGILPITGRMPGNAHKTRASGRTLIPPVARVFFWLVPLARSLHESGVNAQEVAIATSKVVKTSVKRCDASMCALLYRKV